MGKKQSHNFIFRFEPLLILLLLLVAAFFVYNYQVEGSSADGYAVNQPVEEPAPTHRIELVDIQDGHTYGKLMEEIDMPIGLANELYRLAKDKYDLANIRAGKQIELTYELPTNQLIEFIYKINSEQQLRMWRQPNKTNHESDIIEAAEAAEEWQTTVEDIPYNVKQKVITGEVKSSMYQAALDNDIDERAIIEFANAFQWNIDWVYDPRVGDEFKFIVEERYLDGEYVMPGNVLAGYYINAGEKYEIFYFEESADNKGYFDADGNSVQKMFLKAPLAFKYISSGYTTGQRYVRAFNTSTSHRAIDYAATYGTPIRSVGDGTVTFAGWSSAGYGYLTSIRHNGTYSTNYAHQSKIAVSYGQKIKQGDVIGYVGSTGFSTGPHLHYEMVKNGVKINPLHEVLPPGDPIKEENRQRYFDLVEQYRQQLVVN